MTEQERWQRVTDILDQMWQELARQRKGLSLSNLAGIRIDIEYLINDVKRTEKPTAFDVNPGGQYQP